MSYGKPKHSFSPQAMAASLKRRKELAAVAKDPSRTPAMYVTRVGTAYGWEIRRFGAMVLSASEQSYATADLARRAGKDGIRTAQSDV